MLKEEKKIDEGIFDTQTMIYLSKFFNKHIIERLRFITARGKEADLYLAESGDAEIVKNTKYVVIKFFRVETSSFFKMTDYIIGDTRFNKMSQKTSKSKIIIIKTWCKKEFGNLEIAERAGINAPKPYMAHGSILAMEFIGNGDGKPAPMLKDVRLIEPKKVLDVIIYQIKKLYESRLVHADLSQYNILIKDDKPYFIDFGQAVVLRHPNSELFLNRDVKNILEYFSKTYSIKMDQAAVLKLIKS